MDIASNFGTVTVSPCRISNNVEKPSATRVAYSQSLT